MAKRKTSKKKKKQRKVSGRRRADLSKLTTEALASELRKRETSAKSLERRRERLLDQLRDVESDLAAHGVPITAAGTVRKRPKNEMNLESALVQLLTGNRMGVTEAAEEVQRAGYMTSSENFRTIVNQTLIRSNRIKKITRGLYTAK